MACAAVLEPNRDFPAWLEAQGVNQEVARAMDSELGIRDYGVLRACVGDGIVRAELLATARDRLPFGFYAVLRQVVKALRGAEPHQDGAGTPRCDDDDDAAAASSPGDVTLGGLVDVLLALFSGLSRELLLSARRLGAMDGAGTCVGGSSPGGGAEEAAMVEQHLNCAENEEIGDIAPSIIDDFGQNKMMRIIKMEEHEDGDNGGEGSVDENEDGGGGWRAQEGAEGMAASCMDGSGKEAESHSGFLINRVESLQSTKPLLPWSEKTSAAAQSQEEPQAPADSGAVVRSVAWQDFLTAAAAAASIPMPSRPSKPRAVGPAPRQVGPKPWPGAAPFGLREWTPHGAAATHGCGECGQSFTRRDFLEKHTARHLAERLSAERRAAEATGGGGEALGLPFAPPPSLHGFGNHTRPHMSEKLYACSVCGRAFTRSSTLRLHERRHTGEKPHRCDLCGHAFLRAVQLRIHLRTHTGEKPYCCGECGQAFAHRHSFKRHQHKHMRVKV
ncbi:uncharacterized protein LOC144952680 isoform X2 [Lampetra fluviatilis]